MKMIDLTSHLDAASYLLTAAEDALTAYGTPEAREKAAAVSAALFHLDGLRADLNAGSGENAERAAVLAARHSFRVRGITDPLALADALAQAGWKVLDIVAVGASDAIGHHRFDHAEALARKARTAGGIVVGLDPTLRDAAALRAWEAVTVA